MRIAGLTEHEYEVVKYALRLLAASVDTVNEALSDDAADLYRDRWGEDHGESTFSLAALQATR